MSIKRDNKGRFIKGNCGFWLGKKRDDKTNKKISNALIGKYTGKKHPKWKGGIWKRKDGYIMIKISEHPRAIRGYVMEHILIVENHIKRFLKYNECVHHVNGIRDDNRIENLIILTKNKHAKMHSDNRKRDKFGRYQ